MINGKFHLQVILQWDWLLAGKNYLYEVIYEKILCFPSGTSFENPLFFFINFLFINQYKYYL